VGESNSLKGKFSPWFVSMLFGICLLFLACYLSNSLLPATCYTFSLWVSCISSQTQHSLNTLEWSCKIPTHQLKDIPPTQFSSCYLPCDPGACKVHIFSFSPKPGEEGFAIIFNGIRLFQLIM